MSLTHGLSPDGCLVLGFRQVVFGIDVLFGCVFGGGLFSVFNFSSRVIVQLVGHGFCIDNIWLHSSSDGCKVIIITYKRCDVWWVFGIVIG